VSADLLSELARVKAIFQLRAICLHMGVDPDGGSAFIIPQSTSALPTVPPAGAADCGALPHTSSAVGTISGPDSSDHALGGLSDSYDCHRSAS
jgi:hypothetical protein